MQDAEHFDVVIVGAGFAGLYLLHRLRGQGMSAVALEAADGVGGTWYWNRYPGARCDVESMQYSYSFDEELQQEWRWSERFATQPEILRYANHVADRFDLRRDIRFGTRVTGAEFERDRWLVRTTAGRFIGRFCVMATGCLSSTRMPDFPGLESFRGKTYHTGQWPHEGVDFTGQRVGVVGTGSSAIQSIPVIAEQAAHVHVFQRTPNFSIPAHNRPLDEAYERSWKDVYAERRRKARMMRTGIDYPVNQASALEVEPSERQRIYEDRWALGSTSFMAAFGDLITDQAANETAAEFVRGKIRAAVKDPAVAELLCPDNHPIGTKRICVDTGYYETFNRDNVTLVNLRGAPIEAITPEGLRTAEASYAFDSIVFATGFDAMTGTLLAMDIRGEGGLRLEDAWAAGPVTYLGLMVAGFPNLFTVTGPGSPSVLSNMIVSIEQHVDWITDALAWLRGRGLTRMQATEQAQDEWVRHANEVAHRTLYPQANSWYMGVNIPGKPQVFMPYIGGVGAYRQICDEVAAEGYRGFALSGAKAQAAE
ncbi:NAD(P)/FAD-dependent oxidoreductase [Rhodovarius crocodyli]|uniref:NAD(P)/FAD-dependent oxidoreductase n=1 Tax=Rhodovarius crocodyli TaxID=1979269 RepID=A0A437M1H4_9PROT|nr:NAD(P)/FAD-dependent oxidoreductase [Rhodovarius crocodyli]RVT91527.1 NAD(P)/FAD-dependent oxidoreductase [Rhodovarius crocodyli]